MPRLGREQCAMVGLYYVYFLTWESGRQDVLAVLLALGGWEHVPGISRAPLHSVCRVAQEKHSHSLVGGAGPVQRAAGRRRLLGGRSRPWQGDGCLHTVSDKCSCLLQAVWPQCLKRD